MEIFTQQGLAMLSRYAHFLAGVAWIGLLWYFNFVQTPSFAAFEASARSDATQKLVPRALWWFRWGAMFTFISGLAILAFQGGSDWGDRQLFDVDYFKTPGGITIATGIIMGTIMFLNVWLVIWPAQKIVIASTVKVAGGGEADPAAAPAGRRAAMASRTNTFFSIPLLFMMGATSHMAFRYDASAGGDRALYWLVAGALIILIEANALGAFGRGPAWNTKVLDDHKNTIAAGFVLWIILLLLFEILFAP